MFVRFVVKLPKFPVHNIKRFW